MVKEGFIRKAMLVVEPKQEPVLVGHVGHLDGGSEIIFFKNMQE